MKSHIKKITATLLLYIFIINNSTISIKAENIDINAKAAVLIDETTETVLFEKNADKKNFPASTTKIMTALLVLEKCKNLKDKIKMSHNAVYNIEPGSSHIAMNEDETLTVEQALYGLLVASANEVANALAEYICKDTNDFCKLMNLRAKQLGCKNTNFINPHGFHNENHYTSAYDLALIMKEAVKYETFNKIINTKRYDIPPTEKQTETRILYNTNKIIQKGKYYDEDVIGGKTGYTNEAGHTLAIYAKRNNMKIISVVMGEENTDAYTDTKKILDCGFSKFYNIEILKKDDWQKNCVVTQKYKNKIVDIDNVNIYLENDISLTLPDSITKNELEIIIELPEKISAPVDKTRAAGKISVAYKNKIVNQTKLLPEENINLLDQKTIEKMEHKKLLHKIFFISLKILSYTALIIGLAILILMAIRKLNLRKKKKRKRF